jgi:hypothetical protein
MDSDTQHICIDTYFSIHVTDCTYLHLLTKSNLNIMKTIKELYKNVKYEALSSSTSTAAPQPKRVTPYSIIIACGATCITTIAVIAAAILLRQATLAPKSAAALEAESWNYCGRSSAEAIRRGCVLEPMLYGWMPSRCVYDELTTAYPIFDDRKWYYDSNLTQEIAPEILKSGNITRIYAHRLAQRSSHYPPRNYMKADN